MTSQRPFFANFLAAFRAHSALQQQQQPKPSTSPSSQPSHTTSNASAPSSSLPTHPSSAARTIATKPSGATTSALSSLSPRTSHSPGTLPLSPQNTTATPSTSPTAHDSRAMTENRGRGIGGMDKMDESRTRRGSDSSSDGFRDVLPKEKWYVGGRTAGGEERYFKLGVVKRHKSIDRLSMDRLSL